MKKKYIVVGGVAGGATAAARLRRLDEEADIMLIERGRHVSFANCGLPYYAGGVIKEQDSLLVQTPERLRAMFALDVRTESEVTAVAPERHEITVRAKDGKTVTEHYDKLLLAPGAHPLVPPIPGIQQEAIHTIRTVEDAEAVKQAAVRLGKGAQAVVVGGGFIGVEMAENLVERGLSVHLAEAAPQILLPFDADLAHLLAEEMETHGVRLHLGNGVQEFRKQPKGVAVMLADGTELPADLVVLAIGVRPDTAFLKGSGITLDARGHIVVDEYLQTSAPDVYAVGDAVLTRGLRTQQPRALALAGPANRQARLAADNMTGHLHAYQGVQGSSILKVFSLTAAATGDNERTLTQAGEEYRSVIVEPFSHATYYPGAERMTLKLLFSAKGDVLGAQAIGRAGIDKRIDTIATLLHLHGTVEDLASLELSYAPPYSSAKDPVNIAGYVATNLLAGLTTPIKVADVPAAIERGARLIDVRPPEAFAAGHLKGATNLPLAKLRSHLAELDKDAAYIVSCEVGQTAYYAERILKQHGFRVKNLMGGYRLASHFLPTEK